MCMFHLHLIFTTTPKTNSNPPKNTKYLHRSSPPRPQFGFPTLTEKTKKQKTKNISNTKPILKEIMKGLL